MNFICRCQNKYILSVDGFTLLEVAISILIIAIAATSLLYSAYYRLRVFQTSRDTNIAIADTQYVVETIREGIDRTGSIPTNILFYNPYNAYSLNVEPDTTQNPRPVKVTLTWQEQGRRQMSIILDMLFTDRK